MKKTAKVLRIVTQQDVETMLDYMEQHDVSLRWEFISGTDGSIWIDRLYLADPDDGTWATFAHRAGNRREHDIAPTLMDRESAADVIWRNKGKINRAILCEDLNLEYITGTPEYHGSSEVF
ncbi:MAG: hypothetical protein ACM3WU_04215 [Bacillota bacterium]